MSQNQLHDFAATKGMKEYTPVKFLKREGMSLESAEADRHAGKGKKWGTADYISQDEDNPHSSPAKLSSGNREHYEDHGEGNRHGEDGIEKEDRIQKGKKHREPRVVDEGARKRREYGFPNLAEPFEED